MPTERFCDVCGASLGIMTDSEYDDFNSVNDGICDTCWRDQTEDEMNCGPDDMSDDGDALASAGRGTDEDYGYYGDPADDCFAEDDCYETDLG